MSLAPRWFKAVAGGNDFLVLDARSREGLEPDAAVTRTLCDRREGFGADGLVTLAPSARATARFVLRNADGSPAAFSGNGARCATLVLAWLDGVATVAFETPRGLAQGCIVGATDPSGSEVDVEIGPPADVEFDKPLPVGSPAPRADHAVVGVPYLAVRVPDIDVLNLARVAPPLRHWDALPEGANVAFYEAPRGDEPVRLRTWERGVEGETPSSGTGCAVVALALASRQEIRDGSVTYSFAPRSGTNPRVTAQLAGGAVVMLRLAGDARLIGEVVPRGADS